MIQAGHGRGADTAKLYIEATGGQAVYAAH